MDSKKYTCICNKSYTCRQHLSRHRQTCEIVKNQAVQQQPVIPQPVIQQTIQPQHLLPQPVLQQLMIQQLMLQPMLQQFMLQQPIQQPQQPIQQPQPLMQQPPPEIQQSFCLNDYLSSLYPQTIEFYKCKYMPTIKDFNNVLVNGIVNGIFRNITEYFDTYTRLQIPIVVTNVQSARFKMLVFTNNKWVAFEKHYAMDYLNLLVEFFINKLFKYMSIFYTEYPEANLSCANESEGYYKRLSLYSMIGNSDKYLKNISMNLKEYFMINKE